MDNLQHKYQWSSNLIGRDLDSESTHFVYALRLQERSNWINIE